MPAQEAAQSASFVEHVSDVITVLRRTNVQFRTLGPMLPMLSEGMGNVSAGGRIRRGYMIASSVRRRRVLAAPAAFWRSQNETYGSRPLVAIPSSARARFRASTASARYICGSPCSRLPLPITALVCGEILKAPNLVTWGLRRDGGRQKCQHFRAAKEFLLLTIVCQYVEGCMHVACEKNKKRLKLFRVTDA
jgi:hypothetical protein